jgi:ATP-dependent Clp protease ATP-binding subunit ClpA
MFERFTERARQVVVLAQDEARALDHNYIGTEHILLGLLREEEGLAARVLDTFDMTIEEVRAQVARIIGRGDEVVTGQIPFTPRAKKSLDLALREALALGHNSVGTEHILLGLARLDDGVAQRILSDFGLDAEKVRTEVIRALSAPTPRRKPPAPMSDHLRVIDLSAVSLALEEAKQRLIEEQQFDAAAALRDRQREVQRLVRDIEADLARIGLAVAATPPERVVREYGVKTLDGASDTWARQLARWRRDGWELISVVQEGGAVRAILERRRRRSKA